MTNITFDDIITQVKKSVKKYRQVTQHLRYGVDNRITRTELCELTGLSDRLNRRMLELAADDGMLIVSSSHLGGYYLADNTNDLKIIQREYMSRAIKMFNRSRYATRALGSDPKQMMINEIMKTQR